VREEDPTKALALFSSSSALSTKERDLVGKLLDRVWQAIFGTICKMKELISVIDMED
jgi:hypothetical protein